MGIQAFRPAFPIGCMGVALAIGGALGGRSKAIAPPPAREQVQAVPCPAVAVAAFTEGTLSVAKPVAIAAGAFVVVLVLGLFACAATVIAIIMSIGRLG